MNIALIIAGGRGMRMGQEIPKQFLTVNDKPVIAYTMEAFQKHPDVDAIAVVCVDGWESILAAYARQYGITKLKHIIPGGENGQGSIRNIIFQPYQFVCASETERGAYNPQNIFNMRPEQIHFDIADWAIAGNRIPDVAESLWFYNPFGPQCRSRFPSEVGYWQTRIGDHCFYNPTDAYYKT